MSRCGNDVITSMMPDDARCIDTGDYSTDSMEFRDITIKKHVC